MVLLGLDKVPSSLELKVLLSGRVAFALISALLVGYGLFNRLDELHKKYGPVVRINPREISIADWRYYRPIYGDHKASFKDPKFYGAATFVGKGNIFQMTNVAEHSARRRLSANPYALQSINHLEPLIRDKAGALVRRLITGGSASPLGTANAFELCGLYSFEVVCMAGFARDFVSSSLDNDALLLMNAMDGSALTLIFDVALPFLRFAGLGSKLPGFIGDCYRKRDFWEDKTREMVDHLLNHSAQDDKYLLTPLIKGLDSFLGRKLTNEELVEEAMGIMFAGSGTTSTTLTYMLYALSKPENAHIQRRLRDEVRGLPDNVIALRNCTYVNAVIKETFRLYPTIISTLPRILTEPLQVGPYVIPKGTVVGMQNFVHHRNPAVFPHPDQFSPKRWLKADEAMEASLTPFSIGRRGCIGQNLAWEEIYHAVNAIMRSEIEFRLGPEMQSWEMEIEDRFNIAPKGRRLMLEVTRV
ncbi:cytochrome P450 [Colletotrichum falcatum]|nr:cytochrome P450 [Colletotrichum falcatum]